MDFRTLRADEIEIRVGNVFKNKGCTLLLYINARAGMNLLDEAAGGSEYWQKEYYEVKGNLYCRIGVFVPVLNEWVWKSDCGTESNTEKEKGEASDAFKRALVAWGVRELYTAPMIYIPLNEQYFDGDRLSREMQKVISRSKVSQISYNEQREITQLEIVDSKGTVLWRMK